ncbi:MAG: ABC transporter permease [Candidatus Brocadiia bacterium]
MKLLRLAAREIRHRGLSFLLGTLCLAAAVACMTGSLELLRLHDHRTQAIVSARQAEVRRTMDTVQSETQDAVRKLGFNIAIIPADQELGDYYTEDYASRTMPAEYLDRLRGADLMTVEHLAARLRARVRWPETGWTVIVVGTAADREEMAAGTFVGHVPPDRVIVGHEIHRGLGLSEGQTVRLMGREFRILECRPEHGSKDDITLWLNLSDAQALLDKEGRINEILAVEARAAYEDLARIESEVAAVLPDTRVIERGSDLLAKAQATESVRQKRLAAIERERAARERLRERREALALALVAVVFVACAAGVGLLSLRNVWNRRGEIGAFRALGYRSGQIFVVLFVRPVMMGVAGGIVGYAVGKAFGWALEYTRQGAAAPALGAGDAAVLALALGAAVVVASLAGLLPVLRALRLDPAVVLRRQ